jgi:phage-related protein
VSALLRTIRPAIFVGISQRDLRALPPTARREIGRSLFEAQLGEHPAGAKPLRVRLRMHFSGQFS